MLIVLTIGNSRDAVSYSHESCVGEPHSAVDNTAYDWSIVSHLTRMLCSDWSILAYGLVKTSEPVTVVSSDQGRVDRSHRSHRSRDTRIVTWVVPLGTSLDPDIEDDDSHSQLTTDILK